jgi:hypothetical protein
LTRNTGELSAKGDAGASFTIATVLGSGQTERGGYSVWGGGATSDLGGAVDYRIPLSLAISAGNAHFIAGGAFTPQCRGYGQAAPGHACVYEEVNLNTTFGEIYEQDRNVQVANATSALGFQFYFTTNAAGAFSYGVWAVTAA